MENIVDKAVKVNKYSYVNVIQQHYGQGWEDVSEYECNSMGVCNEMSGKFVTLGNGYKREVSLIKHDLKEYRLMGYATRVIKRKVLNVIV